MKLGSLLTKSTASILILSFLTVTAFANPVPIPPGEPDANPVPVAPPEESGFELKEAILYLPFVLVVGAIITLGIINLSSGNGQAVFESEVIDFTLGPNQVMHVTADYELLNSGSAPTMLELFYPFPEDSYLHPAECVCLQQQTNDIVQDLPYSTSGLGWHFEIALEPETRTTLHVEYTQKTDRNAFKYILTSTEAWGKKLKEAEFRISLPGEYLLDSMSYKHKTVKAKPDYTTYIIKKRNFKPKKELEFSWMEPL